MPNYDLGGLRRSSVVLGNGPGAIVDFRADGAPVSAIVSGLDVWDVTFWPGGLRNPQRINELRLERKLRVRGFRLPPVVDETWRDPRTREPDKRHLRAYRFPEWLQCPRCDRIAPAHLWGRDDGRAYRYCVHCTNKAPRKRKVFVIPVRFVMACEDGHLQDFPWHYWVGHEDGCENWEGFLKLRKVHEGLAGLFVECPECKASHNLEDIFRSRTWTGFRCQGRKPWLGDAWEDCDQRPRVLQRGASNLYFPVVESALSIPPWYDRLQRVLGDLLTPLCNTKEADRATLIRIMRDNGQLDGVLEELGLTPEELSAQIQDRINRIEEAETEDLRFDEYKKLSSGEDTARGEDETEFQMRNVEVPGPLKPFLGHVVRVERLREVRAIIGFTRIKPHGDLKRREDPKSPEDSIAPPTARKREYCPLSNAPLPWLPAIEVRGEGIFISLNDARLTEWERRPPVVNRAEYINRRWREDQMERHGPDSEARSITPRFLLVHTLAHVLMRQLTLECGYTGAALRERLYVDDRPGGMAGLLIYTSTSDSEGTLGGLQRQGEKKRIGRTMVEALGAMEWCSSDPLCIGGIVAVPESFSGSACHACVLAPETACEEFNRFLDRAMLVGTPDVPELGFFRELLDELMDE